MIRCTVESVRVHEQTKQHVVNLKSESGGFLPIWIGPDTAFAIASALEGKTPERPLTHDLMLDAFRKLDVQIAGAVITRLVPYTEGSRQGVFHAALALRTERGEVTLDCRPSDAIALAVRARAPIDVDDALFAESGVRPG